jgi:YHS domain-containing protein
MPDEAPRLPAKNSFFEEVPAMSHRLLILMLLPACAGPSIHTTPQPGSALDSSQAEAKRAPPGSTLTPTDPLAALNCGLPTAPGACTELAVASEPEPQPTETEPKPAEPKPEPKPEPRAVEPKAPVEKAPEQKPVPHPHHHDAAAPDAKVIDPMCKMKIDPKTAAGGSLTVAGKQHWFCSTSCRRNFLAKNPGAK